ncbi:unnamed protein product [Ranitomeya imitator]|uniref:Uncharacterized protein n=1 Tax=Ranitomeya imitator TaxID=111125 RepID=A0ABN9L2I5_9NEOB|nr:unnamed protein product [Ranitomeya imitator]
MEFFSCGSFQNRASHPCKRVHVIMMLSCGPCINGEFEGFSDEESKQSALRFALRSNKGPRSKSSSLCAPSVSVSPRQRVPPVPLHRV